MSDVDRFGLEKVAELALEIAWQDAKAVYLSFDIDCVDPAYAPGTGTPEPGGFTSREIFRLLGIVAREGLSGIEVVEVSPPYDVAEITALLGTRVIYTVLGTLIEAGKLGVRPGAGETVEPARDPGPTEQIADHAEASGTLDPAGSRRIEERLS